MVSVMLLSMTRITQRRMLGRLVNNDLENDLERNKAAVS
jgi:hypothetical protein